MAHFYGIVEGQAKTQATRRGSQQSGLDATAASWQGSIRVKLLKDGKTGRDWAWIAFQPWNGAGVERVLYHGPIDPTLAETTEGLKVLDNLVGPLGKQALINAA